MQLSVYTMILLLLCPAIVQAATPRLAGEQATQRSQQQITQQTLVHQRHWFEQAHRALNKHGIKRFRALRAKLTDYPLSPYLDIWYARKSLKQGNDRLVAATLAQYNDIPETVNLRRAWVKSLAKRGRWAQAGSSMARFPALKSRLPDLAMLVMWHTGQQMEAMHRYSVRWQQGKTTPFAMVGLHQGWLQQGHPSRLERWNRIGHLARHGRWKRIKRLAKALPRSQQQWLTYWRSVQRHPAKTLRQWPVGIGEAPATMMIRDGIKRLSRSDPEKAWRVLKTLKQQHAFSQDSDLFTLERHTALRAARRHIAKAAPWLAALPARFQNKDTRAWRARLYILQQDWKNTLEAIAAMSAAEQQQSRWVYWSAYAAENLGEPEAARFLFAKLAKERGYYSFLSAEHIGQALQFSSSGSMGQHQSAGIDKAIAEIEQMPAVRRAYEWLQLGKRSKAAREWHHALAGSSHKQWLAAAVLASGWHWYDQVIRAAFKANQLNALPERFPIAFKKDVVKAAKETGLKPAAIWSIIRQESAFNQHAVSYVGARGLMQLMPKTAHKVAHKLGMGKGAPRLFSPLANIRLGSSYLATQKKRFGNLALAAAAYNAGPHRVSTWIKRTPFDAPEAWVEAIPFNETRRYVQQVMAFVSVYEWRQQKPVTSLIARLHEQTQKVSLAEPTALTSP